MDDLQADDADTGTSDALQDAYYLTRGAAGAEDFDDDGRQASEMSFFGGDAEGTRAGAALGAEKGGVPFVLGGHGESRRWQPSSSTLSLSDSLSDALSENFVEAQKRLSTTSSQQWGSSATGISLSDSNSVLDALDVEEAERRLSYMSVQRWEPSASNLSLSDMLIDHPVGAAAAVATKVEHLERRISTISMQELSQDMRRESQLRAEDLRRGSDLWKKYPLPGTEQAAQGQPMAQQPKGADLWKEVTAEYSQPYYICELAQTNKWSSRYQRNNRNGGLKNIRCFPCCGKEHFARGFCGESVTLMLLTNQPAENVVAVAEFGLSLEAQETKIKVGDLVARKELQSKIKTNSSESLFNPWWLGEVTNSRIINMTGQRSLAFEFNASKRGWNYGWVANKHNNQLHHCLRAYLFIPCPQDETQLMCVGVARSPDFVLYTRKSKIPAPSPVTTPDKAGQAGGGNSMGEHGDGGSREDDSPLSKLLEAMKVFRLLDALHKLPSEVFNDEFSNLVQVAKGKDNVESCFDNFARYCMGQHESISSSIISFMEELCKLPDQGLNKHEVMLRFLTCLRNLLEERLKEFGLSFQILAESSLSIDLSLPLTSQERMAYLSLAERFMQHQFGYDAEWLHGDYVARSRPFAKYVQSFEGHWMRSSASLFHHERVLSIMGVPVTLRMCWVYIWSMMVFKHCENSETLIVGFRNKLLNTGVVRFMYDRKPHQWTQISPLGVDAMYSCQSYISWYDMDTHSFNIERTFQQHKILWTLKHRDANSLDDKCVLFEKVLVNKDTRWVNICEFQDVLHRVPDSVR